MKLLKIIRCDHVNDAWFEFEFENYPKTLAVKRVCGNVRFCEWLMGNERNPTHAVGRSVLLADLPRKSDELILWQDKDGNII